MGRYKYAGGLRRRRVREPLYFPVHTGYPPSVREGKFYGQGAHRKYGVVVDREIVQELLLDGERTWVVFTILTPKLEYRTYRWESFDDD